MCVYLYSERHNLTIINYNLVQKCLSAIDWTSSLTKEKQIQQQLYIRSDPEVKVLAQSRKEQPTFMENKLSFGVSDLNIFIGVFDFQIT